MQETTAQNLKFVTIKPDINKDLIKFLSLLKSD